MRQQQLKAIVNKILKEVPITVKALAKVADVNRPYLNILKNTDDDNEVSDNYLNKLAAAYPKYFQTTNTNELSESTILKKIPDNLTVGEMYALLMENAASLKAALAVHAELVTYHGTLVNSNSGLVKSNQTLSAAAKSHIAQSGALKLDGGTIVPANRATQKSGLRNSLKQELKIKKSTGGGSQSIEKPKK